MYGDRFGKEHPGFFTGTIDPSPAVNEEALDGPQA